MTRAEIIAAIESEIRDGNGFSRQARKEEIGRLYRRLELFDRVRGRLLTFADRYNGLVITPEMCTHITEAVLEVIE